MRTAHRLRSPRAIAIGHLLVGNKGDRAADRVHLEASLTGPYRFLELDDFRELGDEFIQPPDEPAPFGPLASASSYSAPDYRRLDLFYEQDAPDPSGRSTKVSWRCEELRQDAMSSLIMLIVSDHADARGAITIRMRGGDMAKGATLTASLRTAQNPSSVSFHQYLTDKLALVPVRFFETLQRDLATAGHACTCATEH
jgi:hypothetical protein